MLVLNNSMILMEIWLSADFFAPFNCFLMNFYGAGNLFHEEGRVVGDNFRDDLVI